MAINVEQTTDRRTQRDRIDTVQNQVVSISGDQVYQGWGMGSTLGLQLFSFINCLQGV